MFYYLLGSMMLPLGIFDGSMNLASMYKHCKATEDKDLTVLDFATEHLIDIDCLFEVHEEEEPGEKPHIPIQSQHQLSTYQIVHVIQDFTIQPVFEFVDILKPISTYVSNYSFTKVAAIFHPPSVV